MLDSFMPLLLYHFPLFVMIDSIMVDSVICTQFPFLKLQGLAKKRAPGSVNVRRKSCVLLPVAGKRTQFFHFLFTGPGARFRADPCRPDSVMPHYVMPKSVDRFLMANISANLNLLIIVICRCLKKPYRSLPICQVSLPSIWLSARGQGK